MCDINVYKEKISALEDYLEFVNTDIDRLMQWEPELYAAYAAHNNLTVGTVKDWYESAEDNFVSVYGVELYLQTKYGVWKDEDIDYFYEKEVHRDGTLYECGSYWFKTE